MSKLSNNYNFITYIVDMSLGEEEVFLLYKANNIVYERSILYGDFLESFFSLIIKTYLGKEYIIENQEHNHFNWCLETVINNFKKENINFKIVLKFKTEVFLYVKEIFYDAEDKDLNGDKMIKYWKHIFKYDGVKNKLNMETFIEMYKLLEISLLSK